MMWLVKDKKKKTKQKTYDNGALWDTGDLSLQILPLHKFVVGFSLFMGFDDKKKGKA